ncbi:MAG: hypothetical protein ACJ8FY_25490 [Gemmataceae bacterium]
MNVKRVGLGALLLTLLAVHSLPAQTPALSAADSGPVLRDGPMPPGDMPSLTNSPAAPSRLSNWIAYTRPDCCGPIGGDGPIESETYFRAGPSLPIEGPLFGHTLETGWLVQGGARVLFFDPPQESAWTVDFSISNIYNHGQRSNIAVILPFVNVPSNNPFVTTPTTLTNFPVTVHALNRTFVNVAFGQEQYLWGAANTNESTCRVGWDLGGRYGSEKLELNELRHRTGVTGGVTFAAHTDVEIPWGKVLLLGGFRLEWDYIWSDVVHDADVQDLNILLTAGVRF